MSKRYDLVVLGGGTAGIVASRYAAQAGARVALLEPEAIGGDCLYTGCVPSKALLACAERAHAVRTAGRYGIGASEPEVDFAGVMDHVRGAIEKAGEEDTPDFMRSLGVEVVEEAGRFMEPGLIATESRRLSYRAAIIATGSTATMPPIDGLAETHPLTNASLFDLSELPPKLLIIGAGAIGCEMAQAFGRLGSEVTLVEAASKILPQEEPEVGELQAEIFAEEGIKVLTSSSVEAVTPEGSGGAGTATLAGGSEREFSRVLVATGRRAVTDGLGLDAAGVATTEEGAIRVDEYLRTTGDRILAAGDCTGGLQFTHYAAYQSLIAMANALFRAHQKVKTEWIPWTTFTSPEVAHVGLTEERARELHGDAVETYSHDYVENDRAITAGNNRGFAKLVAGKRNKLLGATICGPAAGENIGEAARLIRGGGSVTDLSQMIHVYPTYSEGAASAANLLWSRKYLTPTTRKLLRPLHAVLRRVDRPR